MSLCSILASKCVVGPRNWLPNLTSILRREDDTVIGVRCITRLKFRGSERFSLCNFTCQADPGRWTRSRLHCPRRSCSSAISPQKSQTSAFGVPSSASVQSTMPSFQCAATDFVTGFCPHAAPSLGAERWGQVCPLCRFQRDEESTCQERQVLGRAASAER